MLSFFPSSTGWQCDWKLFWPPESAIRGRTLWVGGRPKGYFDFFEEKTTYVADWLMAKLETSPTRMLCFVDNDLEKTGNWVFLRKSSGECKVHGCINPKLPFCASRLNFSNEKDWTFKWKPEMKDSTTALLLLSPQSDITQFTAPNRGAVLIH